MNGRDAGLYLCGAGGGGCPSLVVVVVAAVVVTVMLAATFHASRHVYQRRSGRGRGLSSVVVMMMMTMLTVTTMMLIAITDTADATHAATMNVVDDHISLYCSGCRRCCCCSCGAFIRAEAVGVGLGITGGAHIGSVANIILDLVGFINHDDGCVGLI
jgi:hypothetical protein